jgi:hypothetical protein
MKVLIAVSGIITQWAGIWSYVMFKRLLNSPEHMTYERLREACSRNGAEVFAKVRLADILPIENSGISDELFRFALQSHFDFVVADADHLPLFAIEFDGTTHGHTIQMCRDSKKDTLCDHFELPVLRINAEYLNRKYRSLDLLSWFVEVWFLSRGFQEAQAAGDVPPDEVFDPRMFLRVPGLKGEFPLWLSALPGAQIQKLCEAGECRDFAPSEIIGRDDEGVYRALGYIRISEDEGVFVSTGMRSQRFPVRGIDALQEVVPFLVYERLTDALRGDDPAVPWDRVRAAVAGFRKYVKVICSAACCGELPA